MPIWNDHVPTMRLLVPSKNRAELKSNIVKLVGMSRVGATPLRQLASRFGREALKYDVHISELINELVEERLLGIKRLPGLVRTFVFSESDWTEIMRDLDSGKDVWGNLEVSLKDVK